MESTRSSTSTSAFLLEPELKTSRVNLHQYELLFRFLLVFHRFASLGVLFLLIICYD